MNTKLLAAIAAIPALAIVAASSPASAAPSCKDNIAEVRKSWDKVYHRENQGAHPLVKDNFRIGKELCQKGEENKATEYLDVVRSHLNMPVISKSEGTKRHHA